MRRRQRAQTARQVGSGDEYSILSDLALASLGILVLLVCLAVRFASPVSVARSRAHVEAAIQSAERILSPLEQTCELSSLVTLTRKHVSE
jgi:hypothetical protein